MYTNRNRERILLLYNEDFVKSGFAISGLYSIVIFFKFRATGTRYGRPCSITLPSKGSLNGAASPGVYLGEASNAVNLLLVRRMATPERITRRGALFFVNCRFSWCTRLYLRADRDMGW